MADEQIITPPSPQPDPQMSEAERRIKQLSDKVRQTSEERDEKDKTIREREEKITALERENSFNSGFVDVLGTYGAAKDHKDEIKAKVLGGYSLEDATLAVLGKAGKLGNVPPPPPSPAGGSADTTLPQTGVKPVGEMTQAERRAELDKLITWQ